MAAFKPWLLLALTALMALHAAPAFAATRQPQVTTTRHLGFGRFIASSGGTITINALTSARSKTGGVVLIAGGSISSATFSLTLTGGGKALTWRTISLPPNNTVTLSGATSSMPLNNFTSDPVNTFVGSTKRTLSVGATLTVAPNQAAGDYAGSFDVTVDYQ